jgi:hypothetical protein
MPKPTVILTRNVSPVAIGTDAIVDARAGTAAQIRVLDRLDWSKPNAGCVRIDFALRRASANAAWPRRALDVSDTEMQHFRVGCPRRDETVGSHRLSIFRSSR